MSGRWDSRLIRWSLLALVLAAALLLRLGAVANPSTDFRPSPDAMEYAAAGLALAQGQGVTLAMGSGAYPARYPCGFPALLALSHFCGLPLERFHLGSLFLGFFVVLLVYILARRIGGSSGAALVAAGVAACSPALIFCSVRVIAENASLATLLLSLLCVLAAKTGRTRRAVLFALLAGLAAGYGVTVRLAAVMQVPVLAGLTAWAWWSVQRRAGRALLGGLVFGAGALVGFLPQLWVNLANLGRPLATGYGFWNQTYQDPRAMFEVAHAVHPWDTKYGNLWYYLQHLFGMSFEASFLRLYSLAAVLLAAVGLFALLRGREWRWFHIFGLLHCLATLVLLLFYFGQTTRLLVPVVPWVALWAGAGFIALWRREAGAPLRRVCRAAGVLLVIAALLPVSVWVVERSRTLDRGTTAASMALDTPPGSLILSNISPVYTGALIDYRGGREVVQLSRDDGSYVSYLFGATWNGQGPPLPQVPFSRPLARSEPFLPLVRGPGRLDPWRLEQVGRALRDLRPVFVLQEIERPPFSNGHLAVNRFFELREEGRDRKVRLSRVIRILPEARRSLGHTPLAKRKRREGIR